MWSSTQRLRVSLWCEELLLPKVYVSLNFSHFHYGRSAQNVNIPNRKQFIPHWSFLAACFLPPVEWSRAPLGFPATQLAVSNRYWLYWSFMEPLHHGELRPECFMSPQWLSQRGAKHCLRDCRDTPDPSWPRGGNRSCAMSLYQLCSFDLIFSRPLMGASEIPPFLLFCLCCQSCSKFLPSSVLSLLYVYLFLHPHVLRNACY